MFYSSGNADKTQGRRQISSTNFEVYFNAVISPTILLNQETDSVVVVFPGFGNIEFKMKLDRYGEGMIVKIPNVYYTWLVTVIKFPNSFNLQNYFVSNTFGKKKKIYICGA